jgi:antitoxin (DNA-binding transcriptional repressor) of toxin-antitoxin stability system
MRAPREAKFDREKKFLPYLVAWWLQDFFADPLGNAMTRTKLWDLNNTDNESDSAVSDNEGETVKITRSANPIAPMSAAAAAASSTKPQDHVMQETSNKEGDVDDDVEDEEEEEEIALLKPKSVKETAMVTAPASTGSDCKDDDVKMSGTFNKYGKWDKKVKEEVVLCTLTPDCLLEGRHLGHCICPIDESKSRQCKPKSFAPPRRKRPNKRTKTETVVLAAVEVSVPHPAPGLAPEIEVPTSDDDEDQVVANLVSLKRGLATSSSTATTCVSIAGPSTATTDDIKELAKLVVALQEESAEVEINLMHAIANKYRLDPANVAA